MCGFLNGWCGYRMEISWMLDPCNWTGMSSLGWVMLPCGWRIALHLNVCRFTTNLRPSADPGETIPLDFPCPLWTAVASDTSNPWQAIRAAAQYSLVLVSDTVMSLNGMVPSRRTVPVGGFAYDVLEPCFECLIWQGGHAMSPRRASESVFGCAGQRYDVPLLCF